MTQERPIGLNENNDEKINFALTTNDPVDGTLLDLTGKSLRFYLKPSKSTDDGSPGVWTGSTDTGEVVVTDAAAGVCFVRIPRATVTLSMGWYRLDVTEVSSGLLKTSVYGAVAVTDL